MPSQRKPDTRLTHANSIFNTVIPSMSSATYPDQKKRDKARTDLAIKALRLACPIFELREV